MKRFLYLFIIIAVVILMVLIGYFLSSRPASTPGTSVGTSLPATPNQANNAPGGGVSVPTLSQPQSVNGLPSTSGMFGVVSENAALDYFVNGDNSVLIAAPDGKIMKVVKGQPTMLNSSAITGVLSAQFSYDGKKVLALFGDPVNPQGSVFDVAAKSWTPLTGGFRGAVWSPSGYQIVYLKDGPDYVSLVTLDVSNGKAKPQELAKLHMEDISLNWVTGNRILIAGKSSSAVASSLLSFDLKLKQVSEVVNETLGLETIWDGTSTGSGLMFAATRSKHGGRLSLLNASGGVLTGMNLLTLPSKCSFGTMENASGTSQASSSVKSVEVLYCGVPRDLQAFLAANLPDDYLKQSFMTSDDIYKIDTVNGGTVPIFSDQSQVFDVSRIKAVGGNLFFINRIDKKVYAVSLK